MRKIAFVNAEDETQKLMIYQSTEGVYVFGYDCLQDTFANWDNCFESIKDAAEYCQDTYAIDDNSWIAIADPQEGCQHDFIMPTKVKGRETGLPEYGKFLTLINGKWAASVNHDEYHTLAGLTVNERLFVTGLTNEFEAAMKNDKPKASKILQALGIDEAAVEK
ncbi:MAG TPA: hypothetical protein VD993_02210 [Chitinophagaceae bacterium]|nr:hypothetical protein [Chitinophagaceae bacterium]